MPKDIVIEPVIGRDERDIQKGIIESTEATETMIVDMTEIENEIATAEASATDRHRHRDDRRERDRDRDRDRDRERERRDRERERDRSRRMDTIGSERRHRSTVNLDDVVPINERKRRMTMWDVKPKDYENVTAEQAKLSGLFPLPGAPRQANANPAEMQAALQNGENSLLQQLASAANLQPSHSRQSKRVLVSELPSIDNEQLLVDFFNNLIGSIAREANEQEPVSVWQFSNNKRTVLLEFKQAEDATIAVAFNGVEYSGAKITIRRPKDYVVPEKSTDDAEPALSSILKIVRDSTEKISIANIPVYLTEDQILELLKEFGQLRAFTLLKDRDSGESKGLAFCEFVDKQITEIACEGLNGMELGEHELSVRRACEGIEQHAPTGVSNITAMAELANAKSSTGTSRVLQLLNMITTEDLNDPDDYEDIKEDVMEECVKFGQVIDLKIPRPTFSNKDPPGVGRIFVRFADEKACTAALESLAGRKFADRTVVTTYFSEENYEVEAF
ncbi:uncharacterized protein V1516DRAFT_49377 [Lipomyces oligophaga]|uniref:uncharacterized protein n=1 Tax=Lipomyces oligophaga TaxID=45792 RepID=UPI0034CF1201